MKNWWKIAVVIVVVVAVVAIAQMKASKTEVASAAPGAGESVASLPAAPPAAVGPAVPAAPVTVTPSPAAPVASAAPPTSPAGPKPAPARPQYSEPQPAPARPQYSEPQPAPSPTEKPKSLPRMLELGSVSCIPCKMMVPVMEALRKEYPGKLTVDFVDVMANRAVGERYQIQSIPTQILFDSSGKEVFRHIGFWPKEEIVAKCKELGLLD